MANNERGYGRRIRVTAAADRLSGQLVVENGFHGVVSVDALSGTDYALNIEQREFEYAFLTGAVRGSLVYLTSGNVLTLTATSNRLVGKVSGIQGDAGVPTGKMHVLLAPNMV